MSTMRDLVIDRSGVREPVLKAGTVLSVGALTDIWKKVLQLDSIGPNDDFFDFGGNSALAVQLFAEIADACGQQLPAVMIYHMPTIAAQVALLGRSTLELSPLVMLKSGIPGGWAEVRQNFFNSQSTCKPHTGFLAYSRRALRDSLSLVIGSRTWRNFILRLSAGSNRGGHTSLQVIPLADWSS
jgi:hypothetical protein